jgi:hypothetical protein
VVHLPAARAHLTMPPMNDDRLRYAELVELLTEGPVGVRRDWAALLVLRMLETRGGCHYRPDDRLGGEAKARAALASLRMALAALSSPEQELMLRAMLLVPWEQVRRDTGLSLRVPGILAALSEDVGASVCAAAACSVVEQGQEAVRRYPLEGLLPELRQPGQGLVITFDAQERRLLHTSLSEIEIDRLTGAVQSFRALGWESNLRPLVVWWLGTREGGKADDEVDRRFSDLRRAAGDDPARWRSLGLLDWLAAHPDHPRAGEALAAAREVARADLRKAAADLARVLGRWEVVEALAHSDPDKGVRQRAGNLLAGRSGSASRGGQGNLFG